MQLEILGEWRSSDTSRMSKKSLLKEGAVVSRLDILNLPALPAGSDAIGLVALKANLLTLSPPSCSAWSVM